MAADPEKAPDARPASDKRPASTRSRSRSSSGSSSGSEHGNQDVEKAQPRPRPADEEGNDGISEHRNDLVPAATVGEPSGEGIYACESGCPPCRTRSRSRSRGASSTRRVPVVVPRARRRGLLGRFGVIPEVERPYDYRNRTKWAITAAVSFASAGAPMGSSIFYRECLLYSLEDV